MLKTSDQQCRQLQERKRLFLRGMNSSMGVLAALDNVARRHSASQTEVALGWLLAKPAVTAPIASATRPSHVQAFARAVELELTREDMAELDSAS